MDLYIVAQSLVLIIGGLFLCIYFYFKWSFTYWWRRGFPYLQPKFPIGNNDCFGTNQFSYGRETLAWYRELKRRGLGYGGAFSWANPVLVLTDPELIKNVLIKDFSHFAQRDFYQNPKHDPKNVGLFVVKPELWKPMRQHITPIFTSAKMKTMFHDMTKCTEPMLEYLTGVSNRSEEVDIREVTASYTTDVVGCIMFGLEFGSFTSKDAPFRMMGKEIFRPTFINCTSLILSRMCPNLARQLAITNIPRNVTAFFEGVVRENVKYRKDNNIVKPDLTQLLIELHESTKGTENPFSFDDVIANLITFFIGGFDTSANTVAFALYELAKNPEMQDKTRMEIEAVISQHNGQLTYEAYKDMTYLRQVIDETLRLYPPVQVVARIVTKPYTIENTKHTLEKGVSVIIPNCALGLDPDHFPDPERFDPERFSTENKQTIKPCVYLPFGDGPRNCIGMRFGTMQSSIGLIQVLRKFKVSLSKPTSVTLKHGVFLLLPNETLYLKVEMI